jgi:hypothetical protein
VLYPLPSDSRPVAHDWEQASKQSFCQDGANEQKGTASNELAPQLAMVAQNAVEACSAKTSPLAGART